MVNGRATNKVETFMVIAETIQGLQRQSMRQAGLSSDQYGDDCAYCLRNSTDSSFFLLVAILLVGNKVLSLCQQISLTYYCVTTLNFIYFILAST